MRAFRGEAIRLSSVWVAYSGSGRPAIKDVSLTVGMGKFVLLTGPNGAGKTTLVETCLGILKPLKGVAELLGVNTKSIRIVEARRLCSYVPQDFMRPPYEFYTAGHVIKLGLAPLRPPLPYVDNLNDRVEEVANLLGIRDLLDKPIGALSGGQQQKVFIARALVRKPKLIFLDEPFASLDRGSRELVARIVRDYVKRENATALVVSHDTSTVSNLSDAIVEMNGGRILKVEGDLT